ncbi:MAG: hypothetical protein WCY49_03955 [Anaerovoracaceae bacterium]
MKWSFPSNNKGDIIGIGLPGIETFQGSPLKGLAREICQNSLDAAINEEAVKIDFISFSIGRKDFPDLETLEGAFKASLDFWSVQSDKKSTDFFERAINMIREERIPFLRISDYNTTGLLGSKEEYNTPWTNLTKSPGASDKAGTSGGSFGIGKFAPYACSQFRTVFYSTHDVKNVDAFQGISRITSFRREGDDITIGVGYLGGEGNRPIFSQVSLDPKFNRRSGETGTDIYVSGFGFIDIDTEWKDKVIASVLDGFLYAIHTDKLIVQVDGIMINKETLPELIERYKDALTENADKYYKVLTSKETRWTELNFRNHGTVRLGLFIQTDQSQMEMHRKVAMIRKTGMKIMDRGNISAIVPFAGVMIIEGENVNNFLRKLENPQHTKWEPDRMEPMEKIPYAKNYIKELIDYIKESLEELKTETDVDEIDPDVGQYLPDEVDVSTDESEQKQEHISDKIKEIEVFVQSPIAINSDTLRDETDYMSGLEEESGVELSEDLSGAGHKDGHGGSGGEGIGREEGNGIGENPVERKQGPTKINASKIRVMCINKEMGEYSLLFVPTASARNGYFEVFLSAESNAYDAPIISVKSFDQSNLHISNNRISNLTFIEKTPIRLKINIDYTDYCAMEVKAFGNKI